MIPLSDEHTTIRPPVMTYAIIGANITAWLLIQGGGFNEPMLAASVCNFGMVPGEVTRMAALGTGVQIGPGMACVIDNEPINNFTPLTSMFLHGSWMHLIFNMLYMWVFGNNIEDSMGSARFLVFYLISGLAGSAAHVMVDPASAVPTVGASGAISGVMGAYLILYPATRVRMFIPPLFIIRMRAWFVLVWWIVGQVLSGLPEVMGLRPELAGGVAFWAHVGGFVAGMIFVKFFENPRLVAQRAVPGEFRRG